MSDTLAFLEKFKSASEKMKQSAPDLMKGFGALFLNIMKDRGAQAKQKELVALGIAVAQRCEPCVINLHVQKYLDQQHSRRNPRSGWRGRDDAGWPGVHAYSGCDGGTGSAGAEKLAAIRHEQPGQEGISNL